MLMECFQKDVAAKCFGEKSAMTNHPEKHDDSHRLRSYEDLRSILERESARLVVTKPLVDSQNTADLLDVFEGSRAIWMYRHYKDVVRSYLTKWGDDMPKKNLRVLVEGQRKDHWVAENVSEEARKIACEHFREDMPPANSAALFWFVRNRLYFDTDLADDARVTACNYDDLASRPAETLTSMYSHLERPYPGNHIVAHIHSQSIRRGQDVAIAPELVALCDELFGRLESEVSVPARRATT